MCILILALIAVYKIGRWCHRVAFNPLKVGGCQWKKIWAWWTFLIVANLLSSTCIKPHAIKLSAKLQCRVADCKECHTVYRGLQPSMQTYFGQTSEGWITLNEPLGVLTYSRHLDLGKRGAFRRVQHRRGGGGRAFCLSPTPLPVFHLSQRNPVRFAIVPNAGTDLF